jgi:hypothetical protein
VIEPSCGDDDTVPLRFAHRERHRELSPSALAQHALRRLEPHLVETTVTDEQSPLSELLPDAGLHVWRSRALPPLALLRPDHPASLHHEQREITGTRALRRAREHEPESGEQHREHDASLWPGGGPQLRARSRNLKPGTQRVSTRPAPEARACVRRTPAAPGRVFSRSSCGRGSVSPCSAGACTRLTRRVATLIDADVFVGSHKYSYISVAPSPAPGARAENARRSPPSRPDVDVTGPERGS